MKVQDRGSVADRVEPGGRPAREGSLAQHVKVLGVLHIVLGALGLLAGFAMLVLAGGIAGVIGASEPGDEAMIAMPIIGAVGGFIFLLAAVLSIPGIIGGVGLLGLRPWARMLTIIISALNIINFPIGTALGVYGLWVLLSRETTAMFEARSRVIS